MTGEDGNTFAFMPSLVYKLWSVPILLSLAPHLSATCLSRFIIKIKPKHKSCKYNNHSRFHWMVVAHLCLYKFTENFGLEHQKIRILIVGIK